MQAAAKQKMTNLEQIKGAIAAKMDSASFVSWIAPLGFDVCDNTLVLTAQNQFSADFINSVHSAVLRTVANEFGMNLSVRVRGGGQVSGMVANDNNVQTYAPASNVVSSRAGTQNAFAEFVCCDENTFVVSACKKWRRVWFHSRRCLFMGRLDVVNHCWLIVLKVLRPVVQ